MILGKAILALAFVPLIAGCSGYGLPLAVQGATAVPAALAGAITYAIQSEALQEFEDGLNGFDNAGTTAGSNYPYAAPHVPLTPEPASRPSFPSVSIASPGLIDKLRRNRAELFDNARIDNAGSNVERTAAELRDNARNDNAESCIDCTNEPG